MARPQPPAPALELVQLTDTHLNADPRHSLDGLDNEQLFNRALAHVAASSVRPDLLVLTGDLVHDGSHAGYRRLARAVGGHGLRACALPGNHDNPPAMAATLPGEGISCGPTLRLGRWAVALLDSHLPGADDGEVGDAQLARLEAFLGADDDAHVLVALHHHPLPVGSPWLDALGLRNADAFWSLLGRHPRVRGVICGHVHQEHASRHAGIPFWTTPATCMQFAPGREQFALDDRPPGYRRLTLHPDGRVDTSVVRLGPA